MPLQYNPSGHAQAEIQATTLPTYSVVLHPLPCDLKYPFPSCSAAWLHIMTSKDHLQKWTQEKLQEE